MPRASAPDGPIEPFRIVLRRLRQERGLSLQELANRAWQRQPEQTSLSLLAKLEQGKRHPSVATMEAVADVLEVPPTTFWEYRLARLRERLDERAVGLDAAVRQLKALERRSHN